MNTNFPQSVKPEFRGTAALIRFVFALVAVSVTLSVGGFIDFLATDYITSAEAQTRPVMVAEIKATNE